MMIPGADRPHDLPWSLTHQLGIVLVSTDTGNGLVLLARREARTGQVEAILHNVPTPVDEHTARTFRPRLDAWNITPLGIATRARNDRRTAHTERNAT